ncbi:MAG TPA: hypothetical protein VMA83_02085 [Solirubrobacteraceae bacterium]|nr:hypothetical protein [Solirubrobacteraceae bacterium]
MARRFLIGATLCLVVAVGIAAASASASHEHAKYRHATSHRKDRHRRRHAAAVTTGQATSTVTSYSEGVLLITLTSGQTVSGSVGDHTLILCPAKTGSEEPKTKEGSDHGWSEHHGPSGPHGWWGGPHGGPSRGWHGPHLERCATSSLTAGAKLAYAQLSVGSSGAVWSLIILAA